MLPKLPHQPTACGRVGYEDLQGDLLMDGLTRHKAWPSTTGTVEPPVLDEYENN